MATREAEAVVRERDGVAVIELRGRIDASAEPAFARAGAEAAALGRPELLLDFAGTDYINSTGIALIVGLLAQARTHGVGITACGLSDHYREIFEITRLADFMTITDSEDGALNGAEGKDDA